MLPSRLKGTDDTPAYVKGHRVPLLAPPLAVGTPPTPPAFLPSLSPRSRRPESQPTHRKVLRRPNEMEKGRTRYKLARSALDAIHCTANCLCLGVTCIHVEAVRRLPSPGVQADNEICAESAWACYFTAKDLGATEHNAQDLLDPTTKRSAHPSRLSRASVGSMQSAALVCGHGAPQRESSNTKAVENFLLARRSRKPPLGHPGDRRSFASKLPNEMSQSCHGRRDSDQSRQTLADVGQLGPNLGQMSRSAPRGSPNVGHTIGRN